MAQVATLFCLGAGHLSCPPELRRKLYLTPEEVEQALPGFAGAHGLDEVMVLSTCHRFEIYGVTRQREDAPEPATLFRSLHQRAGKPDLLPGEDLARHSYRLSGQPAAEHGMRVASSLDSIVVGETQITSQFKGAMALAWRHDGIGPILDRFTREALKATKKIRTDTAIGARTVSISHAAVDLARKVFAHLDRCTFLIIGAGEMGRLAALYAQSYRPREIILANRTPERALAIAEELGTGRVCAMADIPTALAQADIAISATGAPNPMITREVLASTIPRRQGRPLVLADIALPGDIDRRCHGFDDVYLFEIDDLKGVVSDNLGRRQDAAREASELVRGASERFAHWLALSAVQPVVSEFRQYLDRLVNREWQRTQRTLGEELTVEQQQQLTKLLTSIAGKVTQDVAQAIRRCPDQQQREQVAAAIQGIFLEKELRASPLRIAHKKRSP